MRLDQAALRHLTNSKNFREPTGAKWSCINFSNNGDQLVAACTDDTIVVIDMISATKTRSLNSKKYGVGLVAFSRDTSKVVHTSTKVDNTIRFLELAGNKYLRYFQGHNDKVTTLAMSPADDRFLSISDDRTMRLWDTRSNNCQGLMHLTSSAVANFDPDGLIFGAGMNNETIKLYDMRSFDKGPFTTMPPVHTPAHPTYNWTNMKFSPCGKMILLNTDGQHMLLVDAFCGDVLHVLRGHFNPNRLHLEGSFTTDGLFVLCGSADKMIYFWSVVTGEIVHKVQTAHEDTPHATQFSPKYFAMVTAYKTLKLWCPDETFRKPL